MRKTTIMGIGLLFAATLTVSAQQNDKLLQLLKSELTYNMNELQKQEVKPYFMSFRVEETFKANLLSNFGVTQTADTSSARVFIPQIRVGDMQLDNFKYDTQGGTVSGRGSVPSARLPLNNGSEEALKIAIWEETLRRYDIAESRYRDVKTKVRTSVENEDKAGCFSTASVEKYYEQPLPAESSMIDIEAWTQRLNEVSAVFKGFPALLHGSARLNFETERVYLVNTDGTEVVQNRVFARVILDARMKADDGMDLPLSKSYFAYDISQLPGIDTMKADVADIIARLKALRNAPVANPYAGPAILSGEASGVFFHEIFGHRLEGHRLKSGGETFKNMVGKNVLPKEFQVYCDPTLKQYAGVDLNGYYLYDSEGVKARRVHNVTNGILQEFLMSRVPLDGFPHSNGHGRAVSPNDAVSRQSNLVIETAKGYSDAQLRSMLIAEAKKQGKEYGYFFKTVTSGFTFTGEGGSLNSFNVTPLEVFRVYVDNRPDELVRGVDLIGTPLSMFSHIKAGGNKVEVFTGSCGAESGWVPVSCVSPAIFVGQIETQRRHKNNDLPPVLAAPAFDNAQAEITSPSDKAFGETLLRAMTDEMNRTKDSLRVAGSESPFWVGYTAAHYSQFYVKAEAGAVLTDNFQPWRLRGNVRLLIGSHKRTNEPQMPLLMTVGLPSVPDYGLVRRSYWENSNSAYRDILRIYVQKMNYLKQNPLSPELEKLSDMLPVASITQIEPSATQTQFDAGKIRSLARDLSAIFLDYKELYNTSVEFSGMAKDTYYTTTEGVTLRQPTTYVQLQVAARVKDDSKVVLEDKLILYFTSPDNIPSAEELKNKVRRFADDLMLLKAAPQVDNYYKGPVMYSGELASAIFTKNLLGGDKLYAKQSMRHNSKALGEKLGHTIVSPLITIKNYTDMKTYKGTPLAGYYTVDAEGVRPASEMTLIDKGVFKMQLNGSTPTEYAPTSTGSSRFNVTPSSNTPAPGIGTLHIQSVKNMPSDKLLKALQKEGKKRKLDYVYEIAVPEGYQFSRLYRIDVKTGAKTLVKTSAASLPTLSQLENLLGVSAEEQVSNERQTSVIAPTAVVVSEVEVGKSEVAGQKTPALVYPLLRQ